MIVTDTGTSSPAIANSVNSAKITVDSALTTPTLTASNTPVVNTGQYEIFTATTSGGTSAYTFNYLVYNSITNAIITNELYIGVASTTNTFIWFVPGADYSNTIRANVFVTDNSESPVTLNSVNTPTITINNGALAPSLSLSNSIIDQGQSILFTAQPNGGTAPYTYNYQIVNSITGATIVNQLYLSVSGTSNTFLWTPSTDLYIGNTFEANVIVTDALSTIANSVYSSIGYNSAPSLTISPSAESDKFRTGRSLYAV